MDLQLQGKRALVTGSSSGIGEAIAKALAAEGAAVVVHGRRENEVKRVVQEITAAGGRAAAAGGDLSDDAAADAVAEQAHKAFGGVDVLVNNAGVFPDKPWLETTAAEWVTVYDQNVGSMVRMIRHCVPGMKERRWGRVIALGSGVSSNPMAGQAAYAATKGAAVNLAVSLAKELADTGVTSNAVSPGLIWTKGVEEMFRGMAPKFGWPDDPAEWKKRAATEFAKVPSGRVGRPEDIADMVAFLASPRAGFVNGANIRVDGGFVPTVN